MGKKGTERQTTQKHIASDMSKGVCGVCVYLFDGCIHGKFISLFLCLTEHDGPAMAAAVNLDHITYHSCTL